MAWIHSPSLGEEFLISLLLVLIFSTVAVYSRSRGASPPSSRGLRPREEGMFFPPVALASAVIAQFPAVNHIINTLITSQEITWPTTKSCHWISTPELRLIGSLLSQLQDRKPWHWNQVVSLETSILLLAEQFYIFAAKIRQFWWQQTSHFFQITVQTETRITSPGPTKMRENGEF